MERSRFEEARQADAAQIGDWYGRHVNPEFVQTLMLVGLDKVFEEARDCIVVSSGIEYLDFAGGFACLNIGHNHPAVAEALRTVMGEPNILQSSLRRYPAALGKALSEILPDPLNMTFFCNSGTEAVEGALKTARIATGRSRIISTEYSFHGKTFGSLSASGKAKYRDPFMPLVPEFEHIPFGDTGSLEHKLAEGDVAAFIVEPIQGEAGIIVAPDGYLKEARALCDKHGALLILDEVQTGFGRTGKMFALEYDNISPDIICLAKALGGGYIPSGAFCFSRDLWKKSYGHIERNLLHTSTMGGNALAAVAGLKTIDILTADDSRLVREAAEKGVYFLEKAAELQDKIGMISAIRGRGLMIGIEFAKPDFIKGAAGELYHEYFASLIVSELFNEHRILTLYTLNNPNVIRIEPPLTVTYEMLDQLIAALQAVCSKSWASELLGSGVKAGVRAVKSWVRKKL